MFIGVMSADLIDRIDMFSKKSSKKKSPSSRRSINSNQNEITSLPLLDETILEDHEQLLISKLKLCSIVYDFTDPSEDAMGKQLKMDTLRELIEYVFAKKGLLSESVYNELFEMISTNIFRTLPPKENTDSYDPDEDEPNLEASWPHLGLVYELFRKLLDSSDLQISHVKRLVNLKFVGNILNLFDSEDPREREILKTILHRIYGKFLGLRSYIRKQIGNIFLTFIFENDHFNGVMELLEILGSIINGFAVPLKPEHKEFLRRVLIPLHKTKNLQRYHGQLTYCIVLFVEKDSTLTEPVIRGLLKYWPKTCSQKEVMFLNEMEEILDAIDPHEFGKVQVAMFNQIAKCISSPQFQIAERALYFWSNEYLISLMTDNITVIRPIILPVLQQIAKEHWNPNVVAMTYNALKFFMEEIGVPNGG